MVHLPSTSEDKLIATTETPKAQVGDFASLKVRGRSIGAVLSWLGFCLKECAVAALPREKRPLKVGDYCRGLSESGQTHASNTATPTWIGIWTTAGRYKVREQVSSADRRCYRSGVSRHHQWPALGPVHKRGLSKFLRSGMQDVATSRIRPERQIS